MPELAFTMRSMQAARFAAAPEVALELAIAADAPVKALLLRCQVRILASQRAYAEPENARLDELFGDGPRANRSLLWAEVSTSVGEFETETTVLLRLPVSHHVDAAIAKYLRALDGGVVPLALLFSGSVFHVTERGALGVCPIPWSKEARFSCPRGVVQQALELHYPESEPVSLGRSLIRRLDAFRIEQKLSGIEGAIEALLERKAGHGRGSGLQ